MNRTFTVEEIFEDIPGDDDNVLLNIPEEICEEAGFSPGDTLEISLVDGAICITKV